MELQHALALEVFPDTGGFGLRTRQERDPLRRNLIFKESSNCLLGSIDIRENTHGGFHLSTIGERWARYRYARGD